MNESLADEVVFKPTIYERKISREIDFNASDLPIWLKIPGTEDNMRHFIFVSLEKISIKTVNDIKKIWSPKANRYWDMPAISYVGTIILKENNFKEESEYLYKFLKEEDHNKIFFDAEIHIEHPDKKQVYRFVSISKEENSNDRVFIFRAPCWESFKI
jgi:hypothetical protein